MATSILVNWEEPDTDLGGTGFIPSRLISKKEIQAHLEKAGLHINQRLSHDRCPIDPAHKSGSKDPVIVLSGGIYCFSCNARNGKGFTPFSKLMTGSTATAEGIDILESARHHVNFEHVRYVMQTMVTNMNDKTDVWLKLAYKAMVKFANPNFDITRNDIYHRIFRELPFVRGGGFWLHADTLNPTGHGLNRKALEVVSSCRLPIEGTLGMPSLLSAPDEIRIEQHVQDGLIPGMPEIVPIRGAPLFFLKNRSRNLGCVRAAPRKAVDRVAYIPPNKRMSEETINSTLTSVYKGFDVRYAKLIMAAKGVAESGIGPIPETYTHGVSGSQKTGGLVISMASLGDTAFNLSTQKEENFGEAIGSGSRVASCVYDDEFFKKVKSFMDSPVRPILLSLNRDYAFRKLHVGSILVPFTSFIALCDTNKPDDLDQDEQFCRRYIYVPQPNRVPDWRATRVDWREFWRHTPEHRHAFNSLYSNLVDEFFYEGSTMGFHEIAGEIGYKTLEQHRLTTDDGIHIQARMIDVFWAVIHPGESIPDTDNHGRGWRLMTTEQEGGNLITKALQALEVQACTSQGRVIELLKRQDGRWNELVGALFSGRCDTKTIRGKQCIRFSHGVTKGQKVNEELVTREQLLAKFPHLQEGPQ